MTTSYKTEISQNALIVSRLSIERCQQLLAHLHALMHLCQPADLGLEKTVVGSARGILQTISRELELSAETLQLAE
jgi:hypothetical protein